MHFRQIRAEMFVLFEINLSDAQISMKRQDYHETMHYTSFSNLFSFGVPQLINLYIKKTKHLLKIVDAEPKRCPLLSEDTQESDSTKKGVKQDIN